MAGTNPCDPLDVACAAAGWRADGGTGALDQLAAAVVEALQTTVGALGTMWETVATPALTGGGESLIDAGEVDPESVAAVETVLGYVTWVSLGVTVLSLTILGALLALGGRRGRGERHLGRLGIVLAAVVLISAASAIVGALLPAENIAGGSAIVVTTQNALWFFTAGMAVLSIIIAGAKMAWEQRAAPGRDLVRSLLTLVVVAGAGLTVIGLGVVAADSFADWLLERTTGGADFGEQVAGMLVFTDAMGVLLVIVLGLLAIVAAFTQIMLMVLRGALLVILAGIVPLSASFTNTAVGRAWFQRVVAWIVALVLYKPAVAIVYATAFQLTDSGIVTDEGTGLIPVLTGIIFMVLAILALPALMNVVAPLVGTVTGGGSAPAGEESSSSAALPTGSVAAPRLRATATATGSVGAIGRAMARELGSSAAAPPGSPSTGPTGGSLTGPQAPLGARDAGEEHPNDGPGETQEPTTAEEPDLASAGIASARPRREEEGHGDHIG